MGLQDFASDHLKQNPVNLLKIQVLMLKQPSPASEYTA